MWLPLPALTEDFLLFQFSLFRKHKSEELQRLPSITVMSEECFIHGYFLLKVVQGRYSPKANENVLFPHVLGWVRDASQTSLR